MSDKRYQLINFIMYILLAVPTIIFAGNEIPYQVPHPPEFDLGGFKRLVVQNLSGDTPSERDISKYITTRFIKHITTPCLKSHGQDKTQEPFPAHRVSNPDYSLSFRVLNRIRLYQKYSGRWPDNTSPPPELVKDIGSHFEVEYVLYGFCKVNAKSTKTLNTHSDYSRGGRIYSYQTECYLNEVELSVTLHITESVTGSEATVKTFSKKTSEEVCLDNNRRLPSLNQITEKQADSIALKLAEYICPYFMDELFEWRKIRIKDSRQAIDSAKHLFENHKPVKALKILELILSNHPVDRNLQYNLAMLHEIIGDYSSAVTLYKAALNPENQKNNREITERIARCSRLAVFFNKFYSN